MTAQRDAGRAAAIGLAHLLSAAPPRPSLASRVGAQIGVACMVGLVLLWSLALALGAVAVIVLSWRAIV